MNLSQTINNYNITKEIEQIRKNKFQNILRIETYYLFINIQYILNISIKLI